MNVDLSRVLERLDTIYECGKQEDGSHSRLAFSPEDQKGRNLYMSYFRALGLRPKVDAAGNIRVRLSGHDNTLPAILVGSHLDTVPNGGKYDGALGCVAALEVFEVLRRSGIELEHPLEAIVFTDEEGARFGKGLFGSNAACGHPLPVSKQDTDGQGMNQMQVLQEFGVNCGALDQAAISPENVHCFLELHVEQGASLWRNETEIGVVTSIAGVDRFEITFTGQANHAGSTLMQDRKDALVTAAEFIAAVPEVVGTYGGDYSVATVGCVRVEPNSVNVVPGKCVISLEIRDREQVVMDQLLEKLQEKLESICNTRGVASDLKVISRCPPSPMSDWVIDCVEQACQETGRSYEKMPSGAFHDSLLMSAVFPTGMIFIPSQEGISHSPLEYSAPTDIENGCDVLLRTVLTIDKTNRR